MQILEQLMEQAPWAGALLALVVIFVRYLVKRDAAHNETIKSIVDRHDAQTSSICDNFSEHNERCLAKQEESLRATERNSLLLEEVKSVCNRLNESIVDCQKTQTLIRENTSKPAG